MKQDTCTEAKYQSIAIVDHVIETLHFEVYLTNLLRIGLHITLKTMCLKVVGTSLSNGFPIALITQMYMLM